MSCQQTTTLALPPPSPARELEHAERRCLAAQAAWMRAPYSVTGCPALLWQMLDAEKGYLQTREAVWGW